MFGAESDYAAAAGDVGRIRGCVPKQEPTSGIDKLESMDRSIRSLIRGLQTIANGILVDAKI